MAVFRILHYIEAFKYYSSYVYLWLLAIQISSFHSGMDRTGPIHSDSVTIRFPISIQFSVLVENVSQLVLCLVQCS